MTFEDNRFPDTDRHIHTYRHISADENNTSQKTFLGEVVIVLWFLNINVAQHHLITFFSLNRFRRKVFIDKSLGEFKNINKPRKGGGV